MTTHREGRAACGSAVRATIAVWMLVATTAAGAHAQPLFTETLPPEEFAARRARLMERIGEGAAVLSGATEYPSYVKFRQNNHLFYLTGVEVPRALLVVDGKARRSTLFLPPRNERLEASEGVVLAPGAEAERITGMEAVRPRDDFAQVLAALGKEERAIYLPFRPETLGAGTPQQASRHAEASLEDPWDGRPSKEAAFRERVAAAARGSEIRDLDPLLDAMRLIKSTREIALIREATRIAGLGLMEGMRLAQPGLHEYEIAAAADFVFRRHGAQGQAYFALVATGRNAHFPHYHALTSKLQDGDLVLFDYAPDYGYYASDVTRMFPANGRFTAEQRELYTVYLRLYQALMTSIRPHASPQTIMREAAAKMQAYLTGAHIADPEVRDAAVRFMERYRDNPSSSLGHFVGMEVHDVSGPYETLQPGMVFTIEPALRIPQDRVYVRLEDVILVTESGYENMSEFVPVEVEAIEKLMAEPGLGEPTTPRVPSAAAR